MRLLPQPVTGFEIEAVPRDVVTGLYVHVPFCFHKCHYCDFYSITRQSPQRMADFVSRVLTEARLWAARSIQPRTIFFGGGTPSLLPLENMQQLLGGLSNIFDLAQLDEWTIEANPATVTLDYCQMLSRSGVNRLSFGAQSFDPAELATLERHHEPGQVHQSVAIAREAGFDRLNLDLIFGVPGQDLASWQRSVEAAISLGVSHLSCYALTYEPNTPIAVRRRLGHLHSIEESVELQMLHWTRQRLTAINLQPYEISNFAVSGQECRHNLNYWTGGNYIGLGPSAASHVSGWRWKNRGHLGEWEMAVDTGHVPAIEIEQLDAHRRAAELAMLMLRLRRGFDLSLCDRLTGVDSKVLFSGVIRRLEELGLVRQHQLTVQLTERGIEVADGVAGEFVDAV